MDVSPPSPLPDAEKLVALQRLDQFREWRSLDDKRYCLVCGKIITGRQIQVSGSRSSNGQLRLTCPSEQCDSIPMDWALPTDESLAVAKTMSLENGAIIPAENGNISAQHGWMSQLRKLLRIPGKFSNAATL
jgi:hypothetical protein